MVLGKPDVPSHSGGGLKGQAGGVGVSAAAPGGPLGLGREVPPPAGPAPNRSRSSPCRPRARSSTGRRWVPGWGGDWGGSAGRALMPLTAAPRWSAAGRRWPGPGSSPPSASRRECAGGPSPDPPSGASPPPCPGPALAPGTPPPRYLNFSSQRGPHDPFLSGCLPSNPWVTDDDTYWTVNAPR